MQRRCNGLDFEDFNPRSRKGSDDGEINQHWDKRNFNPRSRKGSDFMPGVMP